MAGPGAPLVVGSDGRTDQRSHLGRGFGAGFLRQPDLFPGRRSGETWGESEISLELAGSGYAFSGLKPSQVELLGGRFGPWVREGDGPAVETLVFRADPRDFREPERGRPYSFDFDYGPHSVRLAGLRFVARLDWAPTLRGALWTSEGEAPFRGILENYFRVLLAYRLLEAGGALVHSAAVRDESGARLAFGPSGAGKSTFARLAREAGAAVLSDDLNPLCRGEGGTVLEALPFYGDLEPDPAPRAIPLAAVCRLRKSETDSLRALDLAECLASLIASCSFVSRDPYRVDRLLRNLEALVRPASTYELGFSRAGRPWDLLRGVRAW
jgi:hypothetical protein